MEIKKDVWTLIDENLNYVVGTYDNELLMWKSKENYEKHNKGSILTYSTRTLNAVPYTIGY